MIKYKISNNLDFLLFQKLPSLDVQRISVLPFELFALRNIKYCGEKEKSLVLRWKREISAIAVKMWNILYCGENVKSHFPQGITEFAFQAWISELIIAYIAHCRQAARYSPTTGSEPLIILQIQNKYKMADLITIKINVEKRWFIYPNYSSK